MDLTAFIAENLYSIHGFLAGLSGSEIWKIPKEECDELGGAMQSVARHYDIPGLNQKAVDWMRLARTLGMIYGTRIFASRMARQQAKPAPAKPSPVAAPKPVEISTPPEKTDAVSKTPVPGPITIESGPLWPGGPSVVTKQ